MTSPSPGGFLPHQTLPSPAPSSASYRLAYDLPHPRGKSLRPGSSKENLTRRYVEERLLHTSRRYVKKFGNPEAGDEVVGYKSFSEVCRDLDSVVNVLWLSGTPSLQIPFMLKLASDFTQYVRSFPPAPKASFEILGKLDHCFSSLLAGSDIQTGEALPGFENGLRAGMTVTDMVRCRSLVEQTRVLMVEVLSGVPEDEEEEDEDDDDEDDDDDDRDETVDTEESDYPQHYVRAVATLQDDDDDLLHLDAARIYQNTIVKLNERLGDPLKDMSMIADCR